MDKENKSYLKISIYAVLFLTILKLLWIPELSWIWVFSPLWLPAAIFSIILAIIIIAFGISKIGR